jgi:hypothetical protein
MTFTKNKIAAAMSGAVVAAASNSAYALTDMDDTAGVGMLIANETIIDPVNGVDIVGNPF